MSTVLVTGAAGRVSQMAMPGLVSAGYDLRLLDRIETPDPPAGAHVMVGDITDREFMAEASEGADVVLHLAASPGARATYEDLRAPNLDGVDVVMQAARDAKVRRVVLASSVHAAGAYVEMQNVPVNPAWPSWPCCTYGASKAFAEALGRRYVYRSAKELTVACLRFGAVQPQPWSDGIKTCWIGPQDLQQLITKSIDADVPFGVYHGISSNKSGHWDLANDVGYEPTEDAEAFENLDPHPATSMCLADHLASATQRA